MCGPKCVKMHTSLEAAFSQASIMLSANVSVCVSAHALFA